MGEIMTDGINVTIKNMQTPGYEQPRQQAAAVGVVTPPDDFQPAIDALTDKGREWLYERTEGRDVTPEDLAKAADYERGDINISGVQSGMEAAISALTPFGKAWLKKRTRGRQVTARDLAQAADFERGELDNG